MKRFFLPLLLSLPLWAQPQREWVESVPQETEQVLDDPHIRQTSEAWLELIEGAQSQLDLEFFYLRPPEAGHGQALAKVISAIEACPGRGVKVRVLVDDKFSRTYPQLVDRWQCRSGFEVRKLSFPVGVLHLKMMLADQRQLFLGSQNFDWTSLEHIRELGVLQTGEVGDFQAIFEDDWRRAAGQTVAAREVSGQAVFSPRPWHPQGNELDCLLQLLGQAQDSIALQVMTFGPLDPHSGERDDSLDQALRQAASRGVKVHLLVADWALRQKAAADYLKQLDQVDGIEVRVSRIPAWSQGEVAYARVAHCKYLLIDGEQGWMGTSNWEPGYFHHSRNAGIRFEEEGLAQSLRSYFERDWNGPYVRPIHTP
jgi:phosphatidylserine/phosphatidylglycerophosphate/cardiolipin synthase-like enzyme